MEHSLSPEAVKEVVRMTIDELMARNMLCDPYTDILKQTEAKIIKFFNSEGDADGVGKILKELSDDAYIDIIYLQYRDGKTIEWIAEAMDRNESTIIRNKKRLITTIHGKLK